MKVTSEKLDFGNNKYEVIVHRHLIFFHDRSTYQLKCYNTLVRQFSKFKEIEINKELVTFIEGSFDYNGI